MSPLDESSKSNACYDTRNLIAFSFDQTLVGRKFHEGVAKEETIDITFVYTMLKR